MRFLHTADWHVGKPLRGRSRLEEHAAALEEVGRIAVEERVDAVLLAGDVFDSPAPPPEAERLVYDSLARLLAEGVASVVVAGNHDHPRRLGALSRLLEGLRIHVRAEVRQAGEGGVVALRSRDGSEEARVVAVPFVPERRVVDAALLLGPEGRSRRAYARRVEGILSALVEGLPGATVDVLVGHLLVAGARAGTGERALHLAEAYAIDAQRIPAGLQYVALGHLHRPQEVEAPSPTVYAGSLLELDFGEREQGKRVVIVEARVGGVARVESVPISAGRPLRDVAGTLEELRSAAPALGSAHLRVRVRAEEPGAGLAEQVREVLPGAVEVLVEGGRRGGEAPPPRLGRRLPAELFAEFYEARQGTAPSADLLALFDEIHDEASRP